MHLKSWMINMTREEAKQLLPIIQAFAEGKAIESRCIKGDKSLWYDDEDPSFDNDLEYRLKPETKYRPFANAEECFAEMLKHQPFGWVKSIDNKDSEVFIHCTAITKKDGILTGIDEIPFPYCGMFNNYTFADGTPFGIKEEE